MNEALTIILLVVGGMTCSMITWLFAVWYEENKEPAFIFMVIPWATIAVTCFASALNLILT